MKNLLQFTFSLPLLFLVVPSVGVGRCEELPSSHQVVLHHRPLVLQLAAEGAGEVLGKEKRSYICKLSH